MQLVYSTVPADWTRQLWILKGTNHTGLQDTEPTWYSWICLYDVEHSLRIHAFWPSWHCLIIKVFATRVKFLEPSDYCTMINCAFIFYTTNVFGCYFGIIAQLELIKLPIVCSSVQPSNHTWQKTMHTNYHNTNEYFTASTASFMHVVTLQKGYWMKINKIGGWKWNGNLYNIIKIKYSPANDVLLNQHIYTPSQYCPT